MSTHTVTLHDTGGTTLLTLIVREADAQEENPTRNYDAVQPPASTTQGVFGDGVHKVGVLERDFAFCDVSSYASTYHAKAALDEALASTVALRLDAAWELELAAVPGVVSWSFLLVGLRARIRFIPSTAYWSSLTDSTVTALGLL